VTYLDPIGVYVFATLIIIESVIVALWIRRHHNSKAKSESAEIDRVESKG